jgi:hypothetical protein
VVLLRVSRPEAGDSSLVLFKNFKKDYDSECAIVKFEMLVVVHDPSFTLNARPSDVETIAGKLLLIQLPHLTPVLRTPCLSQGQGWDSVKIC